jgi:hypothetical protein
VSYDNARGVLERGAEMVTALEQAGERTGGGE